MNLQLRQFISLLLISVLAASTWISFQFSLLLMACYQWDGLVQMAWFPCWEFCCLGCSYCSWEGFIFFCEFRHSDDAALMAGTGLGVLADFPTTCQVMFTPLRSETFCCCKLLAANNNRRYFLPLRIPKSSLKFTSGNRRVLSEHWIHILVLNQLFFFMLSALRSDAAAFTPRVNTHFLN